ncbi:glycoprotein Xg isoform X2 [Balaenoptera acutorostrata]|uniref:Glycoprotein Xg isoform X2 n=1 Tax=Balaenoptera acutorostrata TaxID=9767 RepID=A0ABM3SYY6_BALAC|nr:glycoprotein Xg isoform X2 [Balaenoptera acutorostrata]
MFTGLPAAPQLGTASSTTSPPRQKRLQTEGSRWKEKGTQDGVGAACRDLLLSEPQRALPGFRLQAGRLARLPQPRRRPEALLENSRLPPSCGMDSGEAGGRQITGASIISEQGVARRSGQGDFDLADALDDPEPTKKPSSDIYPKPRPPYQPQPGNPDNSGNIYPRPKPMPRPQPGGSDNSGGGGGSYPPSHDGHGSTHGGGRYRPSDHGSNYGGDGYPSHGNPQEPENI